MLYLNIIEGGSRGKGNWKRFKRDYGSILQKLEIFGL